MKRGVVRARRSGKLIYEEHFADPRLVLSRHPTSGVVLNHHDALRAAACLASDSNFQIIGLIWRRYCRAGACVTLTVGERPGGSHQSALPVAWRDDIGGLAEYAGQRINSSALQSQWPPTPPPCRPTARRTA
jgi:hypothetical protein